MNDIHLIAILLLSVSTSLDNFGVGISYSMRSICIPFATNALIAGVNSSGTLLSMLFGKTVSGLLPHECASRLGAGLLIAIGLWILIAGLRKGRYAVHQERTHELKDRSLPALLRLVIHAPEAAGIRCNSRPGAKEGLLLSLALTFSNLSTGISAGMLGYSPIITSGAMFLCSMLAIGIGSGIGRVSSVFMIQGIADKASGLLLVAIGISELAG